MDRVLEYTKLIDQDPNTVEYYELRSEEYTSINKHEEALSDAKMAVQLKPDDAAMQKLLAGAHMGVGKSMFAKAVEAFKRGRAIDPSDQSIKSALSDGLAYLSSPYGDATSEDNAWSKLYKNPRTSKWLQNCTNHTRMESLLMKNIGYAFHLHGEDEGWIEAIALLLTDPTEDYEMPVIPAVVHEQFPLELGIRELGQGNRALQAKVQSNLKKIEGDEALTSGNFQAAVNLYTEAIDLVVAHLANNPVLFSKRSAAHASLEHYEDALSDAQKTVQLKPSWAEGYFRLGVAYHGLGVQHFQDAKERYRQAFDLNLEDMESLSGMSIIDGYTENPLEDAFKLPYSLGNSETDMFNELSDCSRTSGFMEQEDFISMMSEVKKTPKLVNLYLKDDRMIKALCVLFRSPYDED